MKVGQKVRIKVELASGPLECEAVVVKYEPPPAWMASAGSPIIWVRPKHLKGAISVTQSDIVQGKE